MVSLDMTFCASPKCVNECGRKFTIEHEIAAKRCGKPYHSFSYFCGKPEEQKGSCGPFCRDQDTSNTYCKYCNDVFDWEHDTAQAILKHSGGE